jgi:hypothetical protein
MWRPLLILKKLMLFDKDNLTKKQSPEWALFLPSISSFYGSFVGLQRHKNYVDPSRIPADFEHGVEGINFLNEKEGYFPYKWALYSAGHANLDLNAFDPKEEMVRTRDRENTFILGDSGGFQIGKGVWEANWGDPNCPKAAKKRKEVLNWLDGIADYGMILDIPAWVCRSEKGQQATGITSYIDAVNATYINNDYFIANRTGACKFLNVLQGENHTEAEDWYQRMKKYCDPKQYPGNHFNGWAFGGQNMCDIHLVLKRLVSLKFDGLLEEGVHDLVHFLGTSKLEWAVLLTDIQKAIRKHHNKNLTITYDCASPFYGASRGLIYLETDVRPGTKWTYRMDSGISDKKYAADTRRYRDVVLQDGHWPRFDESPISARCKVNDICVYKPGDFNKQNKESPTSWDNFTYAIAGAHNTWVHIDAVQKANRTYEQGNLPKMLEYSTYDRVLFSNVVDEIFASDSFDKANEIIDSYNGFWMQIIGTRGLTGKNTINSNTMFNSLFE